MTGLKSVSTGATNVGRKRTLNEDALLVRPEAGAAGERRRAWREQAKRGRVVLGAELVDVQTVKG